jgi:hypothetical protein
MKRKELYAELGIIIVIVIIALLLIFLPFISATNIDGANYKNVTVHTYVNITNSRPIMLNVTVYQETNFTIKNITLNGGMTRQVTCNASIRDWNGHGDVILVNATLWHVLNSTMNATDDYNNHYTNVSCTKGATSGNYDAAWTCVFDVYYYANNGTWNCNVTAMDTPGTTASLYNTTVVYPLYAINLTDGIDYGNVAVEEYSGNMTANVTNFGNMAVNVTVEGWGVNRGDGLAMNCSLGGNISVANERFALSELAFGSMTPLSISPQLLSGLTIPQQVVDGVPNVNSTYWTLFLNSSNNPGGNCSGFILFSAQAP